MKKILLAFLLLTACVSSQVSGIPEWYLNPPKNNSDRLYGVGYGGAVDQAAKLALNNISEQILVKISSDYESREQEAKANELSEYEANISRKVRSKTVDIEYSNYETEKSENIAGNIYVLVSVSKDELVDNYLGEIAKTHAEIEALNKSVAGKTVVEKFAIYHAMNEIITINENRIRIVQRVTRDKSKVAEFEKYYKDVLLEEFANRDKLVVKIVAKPSDEKFANAITESLNDLRIVTTDKDLTPKDPNGALLRINTKTTHQKIYAAHIAKIQISIKLMEKFGKQIASNEIEVKGSSSISSTEAVNAAVTELRQRILKEGAFKIFGL